MNTLEFSGETVEVIITRADGACIRVREMALTGEENFLLMVDLEGRFLTPREYAGEVNARAFLAAATVFVSQCVDGCGSDD